MKNAILSFILLLVLPTMAAADLDAYKAGIKKKAASSTQHETAEGSGACLTWAGATVDFDNTTNVISGTQSIEAAIGEEATYTLSSAVEEIYIAIELEANWTGTGIVLRLYDASDNQLCHLEIRTARIRFYNTSGGTYAEQNDDPSTTLTNYIKLRAKKGTGANAEVEVWQTTGTSSWGTSGSNSAGVWTADIAKVGIESSASQTVYFDEIRMDTSDITTINVDNTTCP